MTLPLAVLMGCKPDPEPIVDVDTDGDGLFDDEEDALGTERDNPDTDGDGLSDGDEVANGADPLVVDTDGDGYTDRDEVFEGKDPADAASVIYIGGWPYYYDKESLKGGFFTEPIALGKRFARVDLPDQHGDRVDLFDFYNEDDKPVVIDLSAQWSVPSQNLSTWIVDDGDPGGYSLIWPAGPDVVRRGDVYWIVVIGENAVAQPATPKTARDWDEAYPSRKIPVLAEDDYDTYEFARAPALPALILLEADLKIAVMDPLAVDPILAELARRFPE